MRPGCLVTMTIVLDREMMETDEEVRCPARAAMTPSKEIIAGTAVCSDGPAAFGFQMVRRR